MHQLIFGTLICHVVVVHGLMSSSITTDAFSSNTLSFNFLPRKCQEHALTEPLVIGFHVSFHHQHQIYTQ